jgi:hypothetical protein
MDARVGAAERQLKRNARAGGSLLGEHARSALPGRRGVTGAKPKAPCGPPPRAFGVAPLPAAEEVGVLDDAGVQRRLLAPRARAGELLQRLAHAPSHPGVCAGV